ncbi:glutaminyl-peptide cyclotransferase [Plectosphaerella cucumerina]|uniref:Peptide hydrolase n=1 Tax=Plectosphaerella cucumerina TaxID=40658 RepID=A0A8K0X6P1_9PEZI|nr:glutaminyl-peptide cyclotransferase [Plectosphaerella cucumerina]
MARATFSPASHPLSAQMLLVSLLQLVLLLAPAAQAYQALSDDWLKQITAADADFDIHNGALLAPLLITRVPGTDGQVKSQRHFVDFFTRELPKWTIEWQNSTDKTPVTGNKQVPFQNLIIRRAPPWARPGQTNWLTLVAHYDSKIAPEGFIGATDSAAPCAMLMQVARAIDANMTQMHDEMVALGENGGTVAMDMGVQIILLDGEEAFQSWTATDSCYGSRSLAQEWEKTFNPVSASYTNPLDQISLFVLLDLLGSADPVIPSYFSTTHWAYQAMGTVEKRMRDLGVLESKPKAPFLPERERNNKQFPFRGIGDDHEPFMFRGVDILHIIPSPFPRVWHTMDDDGEHLDMPTVRDWTKIVTAFTLEWLDMMEIAPERRRRREVTA